MLFLFPLKKNDDFVFQDNSVKVEAYAGTLTWSAYKASAIAAGSAVAPVAIGLVGAVAIGWVIDETIGWDVIADYGQGIIDNVLGNGGSVDDIYNADSETVNLTNEFVTGASHAVDSLPDTKIVDYGEWMALPSITRDKDNPTLLEHDLNWVFGRNERLIIRGNYNFYGGNADAPGTSVFARYQLKYAHKTSYNYYDIDAIVRLERLTSGSGTFETMSGDLMTNYNVEKLRLVANTDYDRFFSVSNVRVAKVVDGVIPDDVIMEDYTAIKDTLPSTVEGRKEVMINNIGGVGAIPLQDNQAVTGVTFPELVSATQPEDLDEGSANDLGILGILTAIYNYIKSLPVRIVGAFTSLFNMIINAIKAIPDVITSGIDNLLININAVGSNIRAGIDDLLIDINAVGANIRAGIDNLLVNVSAIPDIIASGIDNLLINMGDWADSLLNGVGVIIGAINDIWSWITGLAEWLIALIVPTSIDALQPSITSLTGTFNDKFAFIIAPIKSFGNAYSESKSLYDVTFNLKYRDIDKDVHVLPIAYKPAVDVFRLVANGVVVVLTYISMYNRFRKEVLTG